MNRARQSGQAFPLVAAVGLLLLAAGGAVFTVGRAYAAKADAQSAADLVAVGVARELRRNLVAIARAQTPAERAGWRRTLERFGRRLAIANGVRLADLRLPGDTRWPPTSVRVRVVAVGPVGTQLPASAQATIQPGLGSLTDADTAGSAGQYAGPLVYRQGKPTCPAVAAAFDTMARAAAADGVHLVINSAFRSDREQAVLFARHPDPKWVAPPGRSRHRNATELDLAGSPGAWSWLAVNAERFGFTQRYSWEPWHYGYRPGCVARETGMRTTVAETGGAGTDLPEWVPARYRAVVVASARAGGVPPIVLAALLKAESDYNPLAVSPVGAQGIAQFMPGTARGMGLANPFDPDRAIMAAGRLLGANLREFGSIPLALAAYNAGGGAVHKYGGIPPYRETRDYVSRIMALAGDPSLTDGAGGVELTRIEDLLV